jgi:hypothetical protein
MVACGFKTYRRVHGPPNYYLTHFPPAAENSATRSSILTDVASAGSQDAAPPAVADGWHVTQRRYGGAHAV